MKNLKIAYFIAVACVIALQSCNLKPSNTENTSGNSQQVNDTGSSMPYHFYDDFSKGNLNNWNLGQFNDYSMSITNNNLVIDNQSATQAKGSFRLFNIDSSKDFIFETTTIQMLGDSNNGYGIIWGGTDGNNFYCFLIDNINMEYSVFEENGGEEVDIKGWTKSGAVKQVGENKLTLLKHNNSFNFYVNNNLVYNSAFSDFFGDQIGMVVQPGLSINERKIRFKYFKVGGTLKQ